MKSSSRILAFVAMSLLVVAGMFAVVNPLRSHAASAFPNNFFAPYVDVTINGPSLQSVTQSTGQKFYVLAFITGNGCKAEWAGSIPFNQTGQLLPNLDSDIQFIRNQGGDVVISFGGAAGQELAQTCTTSSSLQAQYQAVINQYHVTHLDFDIEGGEEGDKTTYDRRNIALAALQQANPGLVISFTLPSAQSGLLDTSIGLLNNAKSHGVNFAIVNLMAFDFGGPDSMMGQDAINAVNGFFQQIKQIFPTKTDSQLFSMIGLTVMIGQNDEAGEIFSESDAQLVFNFVQQKQIGYLSFWEVPRDNGSCPGNTSDLDTCSGLTQGNFDFVNIFKSFTTGSGGGVTPTPTTPTPTPGVTPTPVTPTPTPVVTPTPNPVAQPWDGNFHAYKVGDLVTFQGHTYKCIQGHTSEPTWDPVTVPALWQLVQ